MSVKSTLGVCLGTVPLMAFSFFFLDERVARFCEGLRVLQRPLPELEIPDLLLPIVCVATVLAWSVFLLCRWKKKRSPILDFYMLIGTTMPLAMLLKSPAKVLFGRVNTRFWLAHPDAAPFHWLGGTEVYSSFPSGHMTVFTVMAAALAVGFPRWGRAGFLGLALLGCALIATGYHFLSDVLGGLCLGLLIHAGVTAGLLRRPALAQP